MNKQFLSLLLLTSFVGTMSAAQVVANTVTVATPGAFRLIAPRLAGFMSAAGAKVTDFMGRVPANNATVAGVGLAGVGTGAATLAVASTDVAHNVVTSIGNRMGQIQAPFMSTSIHDARVAAELAARPWYTKAGSVVAGYASTAKTATVAGTTAAFEFAKANKGKTAGIVVGTVAAGYLVYKGYNKLFSSNSISLNEQEKASLKTALVKADELGKHVFHNPSVTSPVRLEEVFTTESTGLPKKAVDVLNKHVAIRRKLSDIAEVQRTNTLSSTGLAIQHELKALDAQVLAMLPVVAA